MRQMVIGLVICGLVLVGILVFLAVRRALTGGPEKQQDPWIR